MNNFELCYENVYKCQYCDKIFNTKYRLKNIKKFILIFSNVNIAQRHF